MIMFRRLLIAGSLGFALLGFARAQAPLESSVGLEGERADLQNLKAQRTEIEQVFKANSAVCAQRFFVNACMDQAKEKRRAALRPLQERELEIEAKERRARAEAQRVRVAEREREFAATEARQRTTELLQPASAPAGLNVKPAAAQKAASSPKALSLQQAEQIKATKAAKAAEEARRRQQQKQDYQKEQALRQARAVEKRAQNEAKLKGKKPPAQLPIPSAAEIEAAGRPASATQP